MKTQTLTQEQIRQIGLRALVSALGPVGLVRFLQQYDTGSGDYTKERHEWLDGQDIDTIADRILTSRQAQ